MAQRVCVVVSTAEREQLAVIAADRNRPRKMTRQRIRRGVFRLIADLQTAINAYLVEHNASPKPFLWTKSADAILAELDRLSAPSV
jgi:hypothetical protein